MIIPYFHLSSTRYFSTLGTNSAVLIVSWYNILTCIIFHPIHTCKCKHFSHSCTPLFTFLYNRGVHKWVFHLCMSLICAGKWDVSQCYTTFCGYFTPILVILASITLPLEPQNRSLPLQIDVTSTS